MEAERIFCADQINVNPDLAKILREYTKSVIRASPSDLLEFSMVYFQKKVEEQEKAKAKALANKAVATDDLIEA